MNVYGKDGKPVKAEERVINADGKWEWKEVWYPSMAAYRRSRRESHIRKAMAKIDVIESDVLKREALYAQWVEECCDLDTRVEIQYETSITKLWESYVEWCAAHDVPKRTVTKWGIWMGDHFRRRLVNSRGVGRVYCGIRLKGGTVVMPDIGEIMQFAIDHPIKRKRKEDPGI